MSTNDDASEAILARFYAAESAYLEAEDDQRDFSSMAATLHPDCLMVQPDSLPYAGEWRGHEGYKAWMNAFSDAWGSLSVNDSRIYVAEADTVFSRSTVVGIVRATGQQIRYPLLQMITVRDGRILRIEPFYWDTHHILTAFAPR